MEYVRRMNMIRARATEGMYGQRPDLAGHSIIRLEGMISCRKRFTPLEKKKTQSYGRNALI